MKSPLFTEASAGPSTRSAQSRHSRRICYTEKQHETETDQGWPSLATSSSEETEEADIGRGGDSFMETTKTGQAHKDFRHVVSLKQSQGLASSLMM